MHIVAYIPWYYWQNLVSCYSRRYNLSSTIAICLHILDANVLYDTILIFIHEPYIDWLGCGRKYYVG